MMSKMVGGNKDKQAHVAAQALGEKPADILDQIPTDRVVYVKDEPSLDQTPGQIIDLAAERQKLLKKVFLIKPWQPQFFTNTQIYNP